MKNLIFSAFLLLSSSIGAGEIDFEVKAPFMELEDRMEATVTSDLVDSLRPFARNLSRRLNNILDNAAAVGNSEAEALIVASLEGIIYSGTQKFDEVLSREILERAILIHRVAQQETDANDFGIVQMRIRLLTRAIEKAVKTYVGQDEALFDSIESGVDGVVNYAAFGEDFFNYLLELNKSVFDASAQYRVERLAIRFLQYDYSRDLNFEAYATPIVDIEDSLKGFPEEAESDRQAIMLLRGLRRFRASLGVDMKNEYTPIYSGSDSYTPPSNTTRYEDIVASDELSDIAQIMVKYATSVSSSHEKTAFNCMINKEIKTDAAYGHVASINDSSYKRDAFCSLANHRFKNEKYYYHASLVSDSYELVAFNCLVNNGLKNQELYEIASGGIGDSYDRDALCAAANKKLEEKFYYTTADIVNDSYERTAFYCLLNNNITNPEAYSYIDPVGNSYDRDSVCAISNKKIQNGRSYEIASLVSTSKELTALNCLLNKGYRSNDLLEKVLEVNDNSSRRDVYCSMPDAL